MVYRTVCEDPAFARAAVVVGGLARDLVPARPGAARDAGRARPGGQHRAVGDPQRLDPPARLRPDAGAHLVRRLRRGRPAARTTCRTAATAAPCCAGRPARRLGGLTVVGMPGTGHGWAPLGGSVYATRFLPIHLES